MKLSTASKKAESGHIETLYIFTIIAVLAAIGMPILENALGGYAPVLPSATLGGVLVSVFTGGFVASKASDLLDGKSEQRFIELCRKKIKSLEPKQVITLKLILNELYEVISCINHNTEASKKLKRLVDQINANEELSANDFAAIRNMANYANQISFKDAELGKFKDLTKGLSEFYPEYPKATKTESVIFMITFAASAVTIFLPIFFLAKSIDKKNKAEFEKKQKSKPEELQEAKESAYNPPSWINYRENWQEAVINKEPLLAAVIKR